MVFHYVPDYLFEQREIDKKGGSFALSGVIGEHKNDERSYIIDKLIEDGFKQLYKNETSFSFNFNLSTSLLGTIL